MNEFKDQIDATEKEKDGDAKTQSKSRGGKADTASRRAWVPALEEVLEAGW